jgi:hypothetical protein
VPGDGPRGTCHHREVETVYTDECAIGDVRKNILKGASVWFITSALQLSRHSKSSVGQELVSGSRSLGPNA